MKPEVKALLQQVSKQGGQLGRQAQILLKEDFKDEVLKVFDYKLNHSYDAKEFRKTICDGNKMKFIHESYYLDDLCEFLNENFNKIDSIMTILYDEIERQESEKEEVQENEQ